VKKLKRCLIICSDIPYPPNTGGRSEVYNRILKLIKLGIQIDLICTVKDKPKPEDINYFKKIVNKLYIFERDMSLLCTLNPLRPFQILSRENLINSLNQICNEYCREGVVPSFILIEGLYVTRIANVLAEKLDISLVIYREHNLEGKYFLELAKSAPVIKKLYYYAEALKLMCYERKTLKFYKNVWAISKEEVSHLKSLVPNAYIKWVPAFVNIPEKLEDKSDGKTILYLGALHMPNNIYGLIWFIKNVWIKSSSLRKKAKFIVVGREPTRDVRQICEKYSIELYADVPDIRYYYERATLVINPIFHGSGVNVKTIEAIGYGKPLVTTSKGIRGTGLISGEHVLVADSSSNFEKAIHTLLSNKKLASKLSVSARQYILNNYNYESILKKELARFD